MQKPTTTMTIRNLKAKVAHIEYALEFSDGQSVILNLQLPKSVLQQPVSDVQLMLFERMADLAQQLVANHPSTKRKARRSE